MSYLDRHLNSNEKSLAKANKTAWIFARELVFALITAAAYFLLQRFVPDYPAVATYVTIGLAAVTVLLLIHHIFEFVSTSIMLTNKKLCSTQGVISISTMDVMLKNIDCLQVKFSVLGRLLGYGTLIVVTDSKEFVYKKISKPQKFTKKINRQIVRATKIRNPQPQIIETQPKKMTITFGVTPSQQKLAALYLDRQKNAPKPVAVKAAPRKQSTVSASSETAVQQ